MKHTSMYNAGYRYYIFVCSGNIHYFKTLQEAESWRQDYDSSLEIQDVW